MRWVNKKNQQDVETTHNIEQSVDKQLPMILPNSHDDNVDNVLSDSTI